MKVAHSGKFFDSALKEIPFKYQEFKNHVNKKPMQITD